MVPMKDDRKLLVWLRHLLAIGQIPGDAIVLMCGVAGAGKTTAASFLQSKGFHRLSIDEQIWNDFGRYGIDYPSGEYSRLQRIAAASVEAQLEALLPQRSPVVIDNSFWSQDTRSHYKRLIESHHRRWILLYLKADPAELRARLRERRNRFDANAAFPVTDEILDTYLRSFQEPCGEGELVFPPAASLGS